MTAPAAATSSRPNDKSREVRLGVVMYGGVSLAIYINGVAREFFDAVRGRGVYRLVKALTDSDVVVDVISGTSAGGINGIMLSYALCNNCEFSSAAGLWRTHGDLAKLLRPARDQANATSLLNSEGYYQPKLEEVFQQMPRCLPSILEDPSPVRELDLFVTSTDVDGRIYTQFDDAGHPIDVKDHRTVFQLSHRAGRREPFAVVPQSDDPQTKVTFEALAKLSRATSCFPAAFAPVRVDLPSTAGGQPSADGLLQQWGNLGKAGWFLDGGVLDNKPFTYTIKAISSRNADREVDRKLFYVEPDPECMKPAADTEGPTFLQSILAALIGIPGYESIADDLKMLAARNSKLAQYQRLLLQDFTKAASKPSTEAWHLYVKCRLVALSERVLRGIFRVEGRESRIAEDQRERAARLIQNFDERNFGEDLFEDFDIYYRHRRVSRLVYLIHDLLYTEQGKDLTAAQRVSFQQLWRTLNSFAELYEILQAAMERLVDETPIPWTEWTEDKVWQGVSAALLRLLDVTAEPGKNILDRSAFQEALAKQACWLTPPVLTALNTRLRQLSGTIVAEIQGRTFRPPEESPDTLLPMLDRWERETLEHFTVAGDPVRLAADNFPNADALLFPLEMVGDLREKDIIETVRISPRDAKLGFSNKGFSDKVAGDAMYHFGGFFKRSWRSNDILWGRLDGTCQLLETLLDAERLAKLTASPASRAKLKGIFFEDATSSQPRVFRGNLDPARIFPKAGKLTHHDLGEWLTDLICGDARAALEKERFREIVTLLVEAAQLEILDEDFPTVLTDAISEQAEWNCFKVSPEVKKASNGASPSRQTGDTASAPAKDPVPVGVSDEPKQPIDGPPNSSPFVFRSVKGTFDPFFASVAAAERTRLAMRAFEDNPEVSGGLANRPTNTRLGKYFRTEYNVGAEELTRDMPAPILLELLAHTLLVTRNCVLNVFAEPLRERINSHPLYLFGLDYPLRTFYAVVLLSRRAPGWALITFGALFAAAVLAFIIGIIFFNPLIYTPEPTVIYIHTADQIPPPTLSRHSFEWLSFVFLIVLPLLILGIGGWLARKLARS